MKKIISLIIILFGLCGCNKEDFDYKKIMSENEYVIIDVRTKEEFNEGHVVDAINIPYDEIDENIEISKDTIIFVYCKSGNRSNMAYNNLMNLGYTVYDLGAYDTINLDKEK